MTTANQIPDLTPSAAAVATDLLVLVAPSQPEQFEHLLTRLADSFPAETTLIVSPDAPAPEFETPFRIESTAATKASWTLTASDFVNAYQIAQKHDARKILMLGPEASSLTSTALHDLGNSALGSSIDLAIPHYDLPPRAGLVNSAILYPLTRALFAQRARYPLAIDLGLSMRMAERLASAAQRFTALNQGEALIWPIDEASVAGFNIIEIEVGTRVLPHPSESDINATLALVTGSLFSDIDAKAAYWQRARTLPPVRNLVAQPWTAEPAEIAPMLEAFKLAYTNLREIWSLVLPPNSLLGLKRLSITDASTFRMPDSLWARIVYDFLLAYRLRTINRGHLLGALIPLYLAWVASHINITASGTDSERHIEEVAMAFQADKPYLVSRWRWPDRFNP